MIAKEIANHYFIGITSLIVDYDKQVYILAICFKIFGVRVASVTRYASALLMPRIAAPRRKNSLEQAQSYQRR